MEQTSEKCHRQVWVHDQGKHCLPSRGAGQKNNNVGSRKCHLSTSVCLLTEGFSGTNFKRLDRTDISASESGRRRNTANHFRVQELCESRGGRPGLPSLINSPTVSVDVKQHQPMNQFRALELCESQGGRPGLPSLISLRFLWT